jgi:hypothetical protein
MDGLLGAESATRFVLAFVVVLILILGIAWALRRFGSGSFRDNARGRQPRLAVIDHASVDGRRRLILVRRDNVEHLLMIGGPTDIVVEPNIVRAMAAPSARPAAGIEALPRAIPLPENGGAWPLQPEPAAALRPTPRLEPLPDELPRAPQPAEPAAPPRPQRETLAALADELGTRAAAVPPRRSTFARPQPAEARAEAKIESRAEPQLDIPAEPPQAPAIVPPPAPPPPPAAATAAAEADQSLADMASRLEAALRKPGASQPAEPPAPRRPTLPSRSAAPSAEAANPADTLPPLPSRAPRPPAEPKRAEPKPGQSANQASNQGNKTLYDSLEQEMASLLGRPNKT